MALLVAVCFGAAREGRAEDAFRLHVINDRSPFEGAGAADFDGDGKIDIFSGESWYQAPTWKPFKVREVKPSANPKYHEDFANIPLDVNDDGHMDLVTCTYFGKRIGWIEHPGGKATQKWIEHDIDYPGPSEACDLVDVNGDGRPDLLPATNNKIVFYELVASKPRVLWKRHDVSDQGAGHGLGHGDVNGDGRLDIIGPHGWYEQPPRDGGASWVYHHDFDLANGGSVMMIGHDVDGDGLTDIIWGTPHGYGLHWMKQGKDDKGKRTFTRHDIDDKLHQAHTTRLVDLDGNGTQVLLTGTRVYGHEVEPGDTEAPEIAAYRFDRKKKVWQKQLIYRGQPATAAPKEARDRNALKDFPRGTAGTGLYLEVKDIDRDGDLDIVCPGKSGLYLFENLRKAATARPAAAAP